MSKLASLGALVAGVLVTASLAGCGAADTDPTDQTSESLNGASPGCHWDCPKCPPNKICPKIACRQICHGKDTCVQTQMCILGSSWSQQACACVPDAQPGACTTDAECRTYSDYCSGGCDCRALSQSEPDPSTCTSPVACFVDPCMGKTAVCVAGSCTL